MSKDSKATEEAKTEGALSRRHLLTVTGALAGAAATVGEARAAEPKTLPRPADDADRAFVRIREGLVHYRHTLEAGHKGGKKGKTLPLLLMHAGPGSGRGYTPMLAKLSSQRMGVAPDTLGYGDSCAPDRPEPDIAYYADTMIRMLDALGIDQVDIYGAHTGAHTAVEMALAHPDRVRRMIFDGVTVRTPEVKAELLANYAPKIVPDDYGSQLHWAWTFVRDMSQYFPHYKRVPSARTGNPVPSAQALHNSTVEVLKALPSYHMTYHAVYRHDIGSRLPLLKHPVLFLARESDPNIVELDNAASKIPGAQKARLLRGQGQDAQIKLVNDFLNA